MHGSIASQFKEPLDATDPQKAAKTMTLLVSKQQLLKKKNCPLGESESGDLVIIYFQEDIFPPP